MVCCLIRNGAQRLHQQAGHTDLARPHHGRGPPHPHIFHNFQAFPCDQVEEYEAATALLIAGWHVARLVPQLQIQRILRLEGTSHVVGGLIEDSVMNINNFFSSSTTYRENYTLFSTPAAHHSLPPKFCGPQGAQSEVTCVIHYKELLNSIAGSLAYAVLRLQR